MNNTRSHKAVYRMHVNVEMDDTIPLAHWRFCQEKLIHFTFRTASLMIKSLARF